MYRIYKTLPWTGAACVLALTMACSSAPGSPASPASITGGDGELGPDGSTLKASAPTLVSPVGDTRLTNRIPTMTVNNSRGNWVGGTYTYEFQLMNDAGSVVNTTTLAGGASTTSWVYPTDLDKDTAYRWRARARMGSAFGPWSATGRFITVKENRAELGANGRAPYPAWGQAVVFQVAAGALLPGARRHLGVHGRRHRRPSCPGHPLGLQLEAGSRRRSVARRHQLQLGLGIRRGRTNELHVRHHPRPLRIPHARVHRHHRPERGRFDVDEPRTLVATGQPPRDTSAAADARCNTVLPAYGAPSGAA